MKLLIVEDETLLNEKYTQYLGKDFEVTSTQGYWEAYEALKSSVFDVALLDYNLPDGKGLDLAKELQSGLSPSKANPVLVLITAYSKERLAIESLNLGVFRYLEKPLDKETLIEKMNEAKEEAKKRQSHDSLVNQFLISEKAKMTLKEEFFISEREMEIIESLLLYGKNKVVAEKLFISQGTVRNHLSNIFQKLNINSRDELKDFIKNLNT